MENNILFEKTFIHSSRLGKDIELEVYEKDDMKILSSKGLINFFQKLRIENGINLTKTVEQITFDEKGNPNYCLCKCCLEADKYSDSAFGESLPQTRDFSEINMKYPFLTAERRAETRAIIRYLGLPNKTYSDDEIPVGVGSDNVSRDDVKKVIKKMAETNASEPKTDSGLVAAPIGSAATAGELLQPDETDTEDEVKEMTDKPEDPVENTESKPEEVKEEVKQETAQEAAKEDKEDATDPLDLIVYFGPGKGRNITVREALTDPAFKNFINVIRSGKAVVDKTDVKKYAVITAIKNAVAE